MTLPEQGWRCPECVGQETYDSQLEQQIAHSRHKLENLLSQESSASTNLPCVLAKEQDCYSQLVFDLSCACLWEEWVSNLSYVWLLED